MNKVIYMIIFLISVLTQFGFSDGNPQKFGDNFVLAIGENIEVRSLERNHSPILMNRSFVEASEYELINSLKEKWGDLAVVYFSVVVKTNNAYRYERIYKNPKLLNKMIAGELLIGTSELEIARINIQSDDYRYRASSCEIAYRQNETQPVFVGVSGIQGKNHITFIYKLFLPHKLLDQLIIHSMIYVSSDYFEFDNINYAFINKFDQFSGDCISSHPRFIEGNVKEI